MVVIEALQLPDGVEAVEASGGLRFVGAAKPLLQLCDELGKLADRPAGSHAFLGDWTLAVLTFRPEPRLRTVVMPPDAWKIAVSKFVEVATGWEESPFDFNDCGYLYPPIDVDIGVELVGRPLPR